MKDEAYHKIRSWIISGNLKSGTRLRDQELSEMLGISRTPIREALLMLENEGFVETKANRWTIVSSIDLDKAKENYILVWNLECLALNLAFEKFTEKDINELKNINEELNNLLTNG